MPLIRATGQRLASLSVVIIGMMGLRLDRARRWRVFAGWAAAWVSCLGLYYAVFENHGGAGSRKIALAYAATVWILYYGVVLSSALGGFLRRAMIRRLGEERAYAWFEVMLGIALLNQCLCQAALIKAYPAGFPVPVPLPLLHLAAALMVLAGFSWKIWAASLTGLDIYYCRDMFLRRTIRANEDGPLVVSGPYRVSGNPMYGIGNLQGYGTALWYGSWQGLILAAVFQASIYGFYFLFERPFVRQLRDTASLPPTDGSRVPSPRTTAAFDGYPAVECGVAAKEP